MLAMMVAATRPANRAISGCHLLAAMVEASTQQMIRVR